MKSKTRTIKKLLGLTLSVSICASFIPNALTANAAESDYTITIPPTLTVENSGWNSIGNISASGTLEDGKKLTLSASSKNGFALKSDGNSVSYTLKNAASDTSATTSWEFTSLPATQAIGIDVSDYSTKPAGTYTDTVTFTASVEDAAVAVTGVTLNKTTLTLTAGGEETLTATVAPMNATNKTVTWASNNTSVATVDSNGKVTAVAAGTANITATANDGSGVTATCAVTVNAALSKLTIGGHDFYYIEGETWAQAINNHATENSDWKIEIGDSICYSINMLRYSDYSQVNSNDKVNASASYMLE